MKLLTEEPPNLKDKTRIDMYHKKADKYMNVVERVAKAYDDALARIKKDPKNEISVTAICEEYANCQ